LLLSDYSDKKYEASDGGSAFYMRLLRARAAVALERRGEITRERHEIALGKMVLYENDGIDNKKDKTVKNKKIKLSS
jgi:hypothetical protein